MSGTKEQIATNIRLNPTNRLSVLLHTIHTQQALVDRLRFRGRLTHQSKAVDDLLRVRLRQAVLSRLVNTKETKDAEPESVAHYEIAKCYQLQCLFAHCLKHAKKALHLARVAALSGSPTSLAHRCRVLVLMGVAVAQATEQTGASTASARKILDRAAKLVLNPHDGPGQQKQERQELNVHSYGEDYPEDDFEDEFEDEVDDDNDGNKGKIPGVPNPISMHLSRAEVCKAMALVCGLVAVEAEVSLRARARKSAEEWLVGKEGQQRLQERTNELTNRYLESKATQTSGWKKSTNAATMRHEAEGRSRSQLLKEATADVREQLIEQGEPTSEVYHKKTVDWLTRGWEFCEAAFGSHHPETALAYERLGRAHLKAGRSALVKDKTIQKNRRVVEGKGEGGKEQKAGEETPTEHLKQAVSMLGIALRLSIEMKHEMGVGSTTHARISQLLSKACESVGRHEDAGKHASTVASYYEKEASRGVRCLARPEHSDSDDLNDEGHEVNDDEALPIVVEQGKHKRLLILPPSVGVLAAAEKSRSMYRQSVRHYVHALRDTEEKGNDEDAEIRIGTDCIAALKHSVRVAASFFGTGSLEVAQDLFELGRLCSKHAWDMKLADQSLQQSKTLFSQHGKTKEADKVTAVLRFQKQMIGVQVNRTVNENTEEENDDEIDPNASWLK